MKNQNGFNAGLEAAACQLEATAADYEQMSGNIMVSPTELGRLSKIAEKKMLWEQAVLLRGQAQHIRNLQS